MTDQKKLTALGDAMELVDKMTRLLVIDELKEMLPEYEEREELAAKALGEALAAVKPYEDRLSVIEKDIARAEGESLDYQVQLSSDKIGDRVAARAFFAEWGRELAALNAGRMAVEEEMLPSVSEADKARKALNSAAEQRRDLEFNCSSPEYAYLGFGRKTISYGAFRVTMGSLVPILMAGNPLHVEYDRGVEMLEELCIRVGYRTNRIDEQAARRERNYWDHLHDEAMKEPPVSGQDVVAQTEASIKQDLERQHNVQANRTNRVEDYRPDRPWMKVPGHFHGS